MPVYFITEQHDPDKEPRPIKIGFSRHVERRLRQLQTGNSRELKLMGIIAARTVAEDRAFEKALHIKHNAKHIRLEWYSLYPQDVMEALHSHSPYSYLCVGDNAFEITGYDRKGIPEYASAWEWGDIEVDEFCPACGWACGWTYHHGFGGFACLECGASEQDYDIHYPESEQD